MGLMGWLFVLLVSLSVVSGSLPPSLGTNAYVAGQLSPRITLPLLDAPDLVVDPGAPEEGVVPLVLMAIDSTDPWTMAMIYAARSRKQFLTSAPSGCAFCFMAQSSADMPVLLSLRSQLLSATTSDSATVSGSDSNLTLMFVNGTVTDLPGAAGLADVLDAWQSPRYTLQWNVSDLSPGAHDPLNGKSSTTRNTLTAARQGLISSSSPRLDGAYGWCLWPDETQTVTVRDAGDGCTLSRINCTELGCDGEHLVADLSGGCGAESVARQAAKTGAAGVLIVQDNDKPLVEVGADGRVDAVGVVVSMIPYEQGLELRKAIGAGGGILSVTYGYQAKRGTFASVDHRMRLQQVGWQKLANLMMLGWAGEYLLLQSSIDASQGPAMVVPVMNTGVMNEAVTSAVTLPQLQYLRSTYTKMELEFALSCPGVRDEDCSVWDHCITVTVDCGSGLGGTPGLGEPGGSADEIWRGITAFKRRVGRWVTDATPLFSLFTSERCEFTARTEREEWVVADMALRFLASTTPRVMSGPDRSAEQGGLPFSRTALKWPNPATKFSSPAYNANRTLLVDLPLGTTRVQVVAIITGHGQCEFQPSSHHFIINGIDAFNTTSIAHDRYMRAGTPFGCADQVKTGSVPNEHGTWYYGRNGWCDGMDVKPLVWDVTPAAMGLMHGHSPAGTSASKMNVTYYARSYDVEGSVPSDNGCGGDILMSSNVVFYNN